MANNGEEISFQTLQRLLAEGRWEEFRTHASRMDPADLADFVEDLESDEQREEVFRQLDLETASDMLVEMEPRVVDDLMEDLPSDEIAHLADKMAPDEAADFLGDLDESKSAEVLAAMEPDGRDEVAGLLRHEEDTAGGLMTTEVLSCTERELAGVVRDRAVRADFSDPVLYVYVVAPEDGKLLGYVSLHDLIAANPDLPVGGMANREYVFSVTTEDQQEVARRFRRYDLWVMPVVDERHRLVGRVTVDDVIDVVHEEADEDLAHMAGAPDIEEEEESPLGIARLRLPWLLITMFAGLLNSVVIRTMMHVTTQEMLAIFVPPILAMGGNTGMQSSAVCVRGLALDERKYGRIWGIVWREVRVGLCLGLICGLLAGSTVWAGMAWLGSSAQSLPPLRLAITVALAMANAMVFASSFGSIVPILLHRAGIDPALASGPFISTSNDLSATLIYFGTCAVVLGLG
jgi:magnesium transporter